jgi:hypothetical protein
LRFSTAATWERRHAEGADRDWQRQALRAAGWKRLDIGDRLIGGDFARLEQLGLLDLLPTVSSEKGH